MSGLKWTVLLTILTLTIFSVNSSKANTTCVTNSLGDRTCTTVTGNILSNSTFGTGNTTTTTDWSTTGSDGIHTHGNFGFTYPNGADSTGGVLAFEGHDEDNVFQDSALVGDGHLTQSQINSTCRFTQFSNIITPLNQECPISQELFQEQDDVIQIRSCRHIFHQESILEWFHNFLFKTRNLLIYYKN